MAEDKHSFILYSDIIHTVSKLTDVDAGQLFKHLLAYVNDMDPEAKSTIVEIAFEPIKQSLKRDLIKYERIREKRRNAGIESAKKRQQMLTHVKSVEQMPTNSTVIDSVIVINIINYLNQKTGKKFKSNSEKTLRFISARLNDGYSLDDFKKVIDIKCSKWLNDSKMIEYLRPETLFGTKFESYLNESPSINPERRPTC
jgi:uncharacterized phage protein (TIGR02220 family)